jgi:hypothetical protein
MKRILSRLTSAQLIAMIALFVALGGTAGAAGIKLITGAEIKNGSITSVDIKRGAIRGKQLRKGSVTSFKVRDGSLRLKDLSRTARGRLVGATGPAGAPATLESVSSTGADISDYQNNDPIVMANATAAGFYIAIATGTVTNTGTVDDGLNCAFDVSGTLSPTAGFQTTAGNASSGTSVSVATTTSPNETVKFICSGSGVTTFDLSNFKMKLIKLADQ